MKKILHLLLLSALSSGSVFAQEPSQTNNEQEIKYSTMNEVIIKTEASQNLEGKVWDMGPYYYCKFTRTDERNAILDGWITVSVFRVEQIRRQAAGNHGVNIMDVSVINAKENSRYGFYEVCAGGTKYSYVKRGDNYIWYRKYK